jgi:hypothetical protein
MTYAVIRKCYPEHLLGIDVIRPQRVEMTSLALSGGKIAEHGTSESVWASHRCIWAGGVVEKWTDVGMGWALFGKGSYAHLGVITQCAKALIYNSPFRRVEICVEPGYAAGHRWAKALGLTLDAANLRCYGPGGRDMALYSFVRGH